MDGKHLPASSTGTIDHALLRRNAYLVTENRLLCNQLTGCVRPNDGERKTLAEIGKQLRKQVLADVATISQPDTILYEAACVVYPHG